MKFNWKNTVLIIAFLACTFSFWSCKDDTEIDDTASMSALLDGTPWNGISTGFKSGNNITLTGISSSSKKTIIVAFKAELGTQLLSTLVDTSGVSFVPSVAYKAIPTIDLTTALVSNYCTSNENGQITITEIDTQGKTVSGTFISKVCLLNSSIEITQGTINKAKYK